MSPQSIHHTALHPQTSSSSLASQQHGALAAPSDRAFIGQTKRKTRSGDHARNDETADTTSTAAFIAPGAREEGGGGGGGGGTRHHLQQQMSVSGIGAGHGGIGVGSTRVTRRSAAAQQASQHAVSNGKGNGANAMPSTVMGVGTSSAGGGTSNEPARGEEANLNTYPWEKGAGANTLHIVVLGKRARRQSSSPLRASMTEISPSRTGMGVGTIDPALADQMGVKVSSSTVQQFPLPYPIGLTPFRYPCHIPHIPPPPAGNPLDAKWKPYDPNHVTHLEPLPPPVQLLTALGRQTLPLPLGAGTASDAAQGSRSSTHGAAAINTGATGRVTRQSARPAASSSTPRLSAAHANTVTSAGRVSGTMGMNPSSHYPSRATPAVQAILDHSGHAASSSHNHHLHHQPQHLLPQHGHADPGLPTGMIPDHHFNMDFLDQETFDTISALMGSGGGDMGSSADMGLNMGMGPGMGFDLPVGYGMGFDAAEDVETGTGTGLRAMGDGRGSTGVGSGLESAGHSHLRNE